MSDQPETTAEAESLVTLTADIVAAHVSHNNVASGEIATLIATVHQALAGLGATAATADEAAKPQGATTARKSLSSSAHILSMIDGKPYKMLRRHIGQHGYTPESYREAFGLSRDYPMVARDYAEQRRALAHKIGLGRKPQAKAEGSKAVPAPAAKAPAKAGRRTLKPAFDAG